MELNLRHSFLNLANSLFDLFVILCLTVSGLYAGYCLWDNNHVYAAAENVQLEMKRLKPVATEEEAPSFEELLAINPDVCAWLTLDNTAVDFPVLQGESNLSYINTDVYGKFSIAGSIYLDTRNARDYSDRFSLLYGHHLENHKMFGDLDLYKDAQFFNNNVSGTLILPDRLYELEIFACLVIPSGEDAVFDTTLWQDDISGLLTYVRENSLQLHEATLDRLGQTDNSQVLALSTCSSEFTDARTIILAAMDVVPRGNQEVQ